MDKVVYTVDGRNFNLENEKNGDFFSELNAPQKAGLYKGSVSVTREGLTTVIDSLDENFNLKLIVEDRIEDIINLKDYVPEFMAEKIEFDQIMNTESKYLNKINHYIETAINNNFIDCSDGYGIERIEKFLKIVPKGSLSQRKDFLKSLYLNGNKISKSRIEEIIKNITGGKSIIKFWTENEKGNPFPKFAYLEIRVLSPDIAKDYNFLNVERIIKPLIAAHIKLSIKKWFSTWIDIKDSYDSWETIFNSAVNWDKIYSFIP